MGNITPKIGFSEEVYQIEDSDPVKGGPGGINNRAAEQLLGNDIWLREGITNAQNSINDQALRVQSVEGGLDGLATLYQNLSNDNIATNQELLSLSDRSGLNQGGTKDLAGMGGAGTTYFSFDSLNKYIICESAGVTYSIPESIFADLPVSLYPDGRKTAVIHFFAYHACTLRKETNIIPYYRGAISSGTIAQNSQMSISLAQGDMATIVLSAPRTVMIHVTAQK